MADWWGLRRQPADQSRRFVEAFRDCLAELGYAPGERVSRGDFAIAVFRSSRQFTADSGSPGAPAVRAAPQVTSPVAPAPIAR